MEIRNKAMSWCLKNHILVYPVVAQETYICRAKKKRTLNKVRLCLSIEKSTHMGTELYRQDEMHVKINEIYNYYYNQKTD